MALAVPVLPMVGLPGLQRHRGSHLGTTDGSHPTSAVRAVAFYACADYKARGTVGNRTGQEFQVSLKPLQIIRAGAASR